MNPKGRRKGNRVRKGKKQIGLREAIQHCRTEIMIRECKEKGRVQGLVGN